MRILAIADIDDLHWEYGRRSADVLLSCGDVFDQVILEAAEACACRTIRHRDWCGSRCTLPGVFACQETQNNRELQDAHIRKRQATHNVAASDYLWGGSGG